MDSKRPIKLMQVAKELASNEHLVNPFPWLAQMRQEEPIRFDIERNCWDVFSYSQVQSILRDYQTFSSNNPNPMLIESILRMDPPQHSQMRKIVSQAFTTKAIEQLKPQMEQVINELLEPIKSKHEVDIIQEIAYPLPVMVIANMLGVPVEDRPFFKHWSDTIVKGPTSTVPGELKKLHEEKIQARRELYEYFQSIIEKRRMKPQPDLITKLVHSEVDGSTLSMEEILDFCALLLVAGNETSTNFIGNMVRRLVEDATLFGELQSNPNQLDSFLEEVLRFYPPILTTSRYATQDIEIQGQQIKKGERVVVWLASANRDESKFMNSEKFQLNRTPNPHLGFGFGIHHCLGASLARLETKLVLEKLLAKFHSVQLTSNNYLLQPIRSPFVNGLKELLVQFN